MNLNEIKKSDVVILDANIFVYGTLETSQQCMRLLRRCAERDVTGVVGLQQIAELMHRLMMIEARENDWTTGGNPAKALSDHPDRVRSLNRYAQAIKGFFVSGFRFESLLKEDFGIALALQRQYGLMTNDALIVSMAERLRIQSIASADKSFANVRGVILYEPDDL